MKFRQIAVGALACWLGLALMACNSPSTLASGTQNQPVASTPQATQATTYRPTYTAPRRYVREETVTTYRPVTVHKKRSWQKSALIIGSSAGAGALIGGLAKGGKGAAVGAAAGGVGGFIYDQLTRNKQ